MNREADIARLLRESRKIAVVGLSPDPRRDSHRVAVYLRQSGYRIIPVNPRVSTVLDAPAYASLREVPDRVDVVDVFRRPEFVPGIVDDAIAAGVPAIWLQLGVVHPEAAGRAEQAGLTVVMDRCMMVEHRRHLARL